MKSLYYITAACVAIVLLGAGPRPITASNYVCNEKWTKIFQNNAMGASVFGSKADLQQAIRQGAQVRVHVPAWVGNGYTASTANAYVTQNNVCAQALMSVSKSSYKTMKSPTYWWFTNLCTTGNVHMSRWMVGVHTFAGDTTVTAGIVWFVRYLGCTSGDSTSLTTSAGDVQPLVEAAQAGADIRGVAANGYAFPATNIAWSADESQLAVQSLWHMSQVRVSDYMKFQTNAYWWFTIWGAHGSRDMSRWSVGDHVDRGHSHDTTTVDWFQDPCWVLAYSHASNGNAMDGSLNFLREAILKGHRVRVRMGNYAIEPDNISVRDTHVNAQLLGHVSKASLTTFQDNAYWYWQQISTTGVVRTYRYNVGAPTSRGNTDATAAISWFVDTRPWSHALSHSSSGAVTHGSKADLVQAVRGGAMVRYVVRFPTSIAIMQADNLAISNSSEVGAQHIRSVSQSHSGAHDTILQSNPYWWFTITSTVGTVDMMRYTVGEHTARGHTQKTASVDWFVNI